MSLQLIIPLVTFIGIGALAWLLLDLFSGQAGRAENRLDMLSDPRKSRDNSRDEKKSDAIARVLTKASPALAAPLTPKTEAEMSRLKKDLVEAGFRSEDGTRRLHSRAQYLCIDLSCLPVVVRRFVHQRHEL